MKRFHLFVLCAAAAGAVILVQAVLAQEQKAPQDLATLIQSGQTKQALEQIQKGADVNKAQGDGTTPLIWAVDRTDYDVAEALIAKKADVNATNEFGANPLTLAARASNERLIKLLLDAGAKVDSRNPDGETALMMAISGGNLNIVQMLLEHGANANTIENFHNQTPLMYAAASSRNAAQMVKLLLAKGADPKPLALYSDWPSQITNEPRAQYRSVGGLNALMYATRGGCYGCAEDLIAAGADVNYPTPEGITPLMLALDNQHNDIAKLLIDKGADVNVWDWWGRTALWIAVDRKGGAAGGGGARGGGGFGGGGGGRAQVGGGGGRGGRGGPGGGLPTSFGPDTSGGGRAPVSSLDIINVLVNMGVNVNPEMNFHRPNDASSNRGRFADNEVSTGTTPLFRAVQNNDLETIQLLLDKGADPNINTMGYTPFLLASGAGPGGRGGAGGGPNTQILDVLLKYHADLNAKVTGPCCDAAKVYSFDVSRENMGPCREPASKGGTTALHEAARAVRTDLVKYLLDHGANPNRLDVDGKKPTDVINVQRPRGSDPLPCTAAAGAAGEAQAQGQAQGQAGAAPAAPAAAAAVARGQGGAPARGGAGGGGRGGAGRGPDPAAIAQIRAMLEAAATKK